jgi:adenylate kinase
MNKYQTILLFGAPGSGKGTQGVTLGKVPGFYHCACGDVFRTLDTRTPLGRAFLEYSSKGELVPDELTVKLWQLRISQSKETHVFKPDIDRLVLDGIPRNVQQARLLESVIDVEAVFHLYCKDRAQLVTRLKKRALKDNRLDDANEEIIRTRLDTYERETSPLLEHYGPSKVIEVDAMTPPIEVLGSIINALLNKGIVPRLAV